MEGWFSTSFYTEILQHFLQFKVARHPKTRLSCGSGRLQVCLRRDVHSPFTLPAGELWSLPKDLQPFVPAVKIGTNVGSPSLHHTQVDDDLDQMVGLRQPQCMLCTITIQVICCCLATSSQISFQDGTNSSQCIRGQQSRLGLPMISYDHFIHGTDCVSS